jgi:hypothetical protein
MLRAYSLGEEPPLAGERSVELACPSELGGEAPARLRGWHGLGRVECPASANHHTALLLLLLRLLQRACPPLSLCPALHPLKPHPAISHSHAHACHRRAHTPSKAPVQHKSAKTGEKAVGGRFSASCLRATFRLVRGKPCPWQKAQAAGDKSTH